MLALVLDHHARPVERRLVPQPIPRSREVLVRVRASGVNPLTGEGRAHHGDILREATKLAEAGRLVPFLDPRRFTFENVEAAHQALESGTAVGKVVVEIDLGRDREGV
jgi:NADPH:quinone reductase-like Zn-dependent oxidoreductase